MSTQKGFFYDEGRCVKCLGCQLACKAAHELEPGIDWRTVTETWHGEFPNVTRTFFSLSCLHCEKPACLAACPTGAITKRAEEGAVVVDRATCNGCRDCLTACPWQVPRFGKDGVMQKCDLCLGLGRPPACVESCPAEALEFGPLEELARRPMVRQVNRMEGATLPAVVIARQVRRPLS